MSSRYDVAVVLTLKFSVSPTLTLISVVKPWLKMIPEPLTSQVLLGLPGLLFSHATGLAMGAQGSAAASVARKIGTIAAASRNVSMAAVRLVAARKKRMAIRPPCRAVSPALIVKSS